MIDKNDIKIIREYMNNKGEFVLGSFKPDEVPEDAEIVEYVNTNGEEVIGGVKIEDVSLSIDDIKNLQVLTDKDLEDLLNEDE